MEKFVNGPAHPAPQFLQFANGTITVLYAVPFLVQESINVIASLRAVIIRHKRSLDVCFKLIKVYPAWKKYKGYWINMGFVSSWPIEARTHTLKIDNIHDWEKCLEPELKCLRYAKWRQL